MDDRFAAWRVALLNSTGLATVGELVIACADGAVLQASDPSLVARRLNGHGASPSEPANGTREMRYPTGADIICGDSRAVLSDFPNEAIHLVITSPPYFNAKPTYSEYADYDEYLALLRDVFRQCYRVLAEGRFMVVNASPVLVRRSRRNQSSRRIPVPFHINQILEQLGFDFLDDIVWVKPSGAGWNTGRGRRFAADRHPLQYKPVPVTESFLVYRKHTEKLIDWNIRKHPDQGAVARSRIPNGYEVTNVWRERPANHPSHPAVFPKELIRKLIRYYSFENDIVLDPFAGVGTVGNAAVAEKRRYCLIDNNQEYCGIMRRDLLGPRCQKLSI